jgi:hypothetical protein
VLNEVGVCCRADTERAYRDEVAVEAWTKQSLTLFYEGAPGRYDEPFSKELGLQEFML